MSPLTPTVRGADLQAVIRELFKIASSDTGFNTEETTYTTDNPININSTDTQGTNGTTYTETEAGDKKENGIGNGPTTDTGDPSKTGGDSNPNPNESNPGTPTTATAKGNKGGGGGRGGKGGRHK